jgi:hypothetical protein
MCESLPCRETHILYQMSPISFQQVRNYSLILVVGVASLSRFRRPFLTAFRLRKDSSTGDARVCKRLPLNE